MNSHSNVNIRLLEDTDLPKIPTFFSGLSEASRNFYHPYTFDDSAVQLTAEEIKSEDCVHIGAFSDQKMVGHVWYRGRDDYPVLGIGIIDAFQNMGIGQRLMQKIEITAQQRGKLGLSLTCYLENYRAIRVYAKQGYRLVGRNSNDTQFRMIRRFADQQSPFSVRGIYASSIPWNIAPLTTDTWGLEDWKWYIELLNAAGCNLLKIYIWSTQYYHPDEPSLVCNAWRYPVWHDALEYARVMGMETHVGFSTSTVPPSVWLRFPQLRAEDVNYTGITLCWQRGKEQILPFQDYLIDTFADVTDSFVLWFADPGACICSDCRNYLRVIMSAFYTLSDRIDGKTNVALCPWWIESIEAGRLGFDSHPNLRHQFATEIPDGSRVIIQSTEYKTIDIMREHGLNPLPLAFFLDPEGGFESNNILPEPKFRQIDQWLEASLESKHGASLAYRLTPYTQYSSDYYFFNRQLDPKKSRNSILTQLGDFVCNPRSQKGFGDATACFASAMESLDGWWYDRHRPDLDDAVRRLRNLTGSHNAVTNLADAATILLHLVERSTDLSIEELTEELRLKMSIMPIFRGLTLDYLWSKRAQAFLQLRIQNWLTRL